jgi:hypothetical protein
VVGELSSKGFTKRAGVKAARNRYGYESGIYTDCDMVRATAWLMRWNGVPLRVQEPPPIQRPVPQNVHIVPVPNIVHHPAPEIVMQGGRAVVMHRPGTPGSNGFSGFAAPHARGLRSEIKRGR